MCNTGAHMSLFIVVILMLNSCQETIPVSTIDSRFLLLRTPTCKFASTYFWKLLYKLSKKRDIVNDTHTWEQMEWNIFRSWLIKIIIIYSLMRKSSSNFKFVNILLNYTPYPLICMQIYFLPYILHYKPRLLHHNTRLAKSLIANLGTTKAHGEGASLFAPDPVLRVLSHVQSPLVVDVITRLTGRPRSIKWSLTVLYTYVTNIYREWSMEQYVHRLSTLLKKISPRRSINF